MEGGWTQAASLLLLAGLACAGCGDPSAAPVGDQGEDSASDTAPDRVAADRPPDRPVATCRDLDPEDQSEPWLVVSSGFHTFECLADGAEVPMIMGIQGGYHIWGALRAGGFEAGVNEYFHLDYTFEQAGQLVAEAHYSDVIRRPEDLDGGPYQYDSVAVIFDADLVPEGQLNVAGTLRLRLWREDGADLADEIALVPNEITF